MRGARVHTCPYSLGGHMRRRTTRQQDSNKLLTSVPVEAGQQQRATPGQLPDDICASVVIHLNYSQNVWDLIRRGPNSRTPLRACFFQLDDVWLTQQAVAHQYFPDTGDIHWVQKETTLAAAGTPVTIMTSRQPQTDTIFRSARSLHLSSEHSVVHARINATATGQMAQ
jgi:hypothetical protein